jgi:hypothetical protein
LEQQTEMPFYQFADLFLADGFHSTLELCGEKIGMVKNPLEQLSFGDWRIFSVEDKGI